MNARSIFGANNSMPRGFSLIEVLIAVVVLSLGLLSLALLQGALVRGGSAAKAQTQAMALAQQSLEQFRGFKTSTGNTDSYAAIVAGTDSVTIGANTYDRTVTVDRYQYQATPGGSGGTFEPVTTDTTVVAVGNNEFKQVMVNVSWTDETGQTRTVQVGDVISVSAPADSLSALASPVTFHQGPKVYIDPTKFAAGVIPIALSNTQSAAASDPQPESFSTGHITTRFSVQNYSTADTSHGFDLLQKQFDFALTSCTCTMNGTSSSSIPSYGPTYWNGSKYIAPSTIVGKQIGDDIVGKGSGSSEDPVLCNACCRDHHDIASTVDQPYPVKFDPFRPDGEYSGVANGDHKHYDTNSNILQTTEVATDDGTEYYETCRFVRVDGVNYVSTDARQENHILIAPVSPITITSVNKACDPTGDSITGGTCQDHSLDSTTSGTTYPNFVIDYVTAFYTAWQAADVAGTYPLPSGSVTPGIGDLLLIGNDPTKPSTLATNYASLINPPTQTVLSLAKGNTDLMEGRGIYIDFISAETKAALACVGHTENPDCLAYSSLTALEVLPFVAVNQTNLDSWGPTTTSTIISVTDAPIPSGGTYDPFIIGYTFDRGTVSALAEGTDNAIAQARLGNAGIIDSRTISPSYPLEAFNCVASGVTAPCTEDPPTTGSYDTSTSSGPRFQTDAQPYTVTASGGTTNVPFNASWSDNSVVSSGKSNFNSGSISLTVTSPTLTPSTLQNCTLGKGSKQPYTCFSTSTDTSIVLQFAGYNSAVSCKPSKNVTCPNPPAINDYKLCSFSGLPGSVTATIGTVVNAGCYSSGDPAGCTGNELTPVTLTLNVGSGSISSILGTLTNFTANFYDQSATCP